MNYSKSISVTKGCFDIVITSKKAIRLGESFITNMFNHIIQKSVLTIFPLIYKYYPIIYMYK